MLQAFENRLIRQVRILHDLAKVGCLLGNPTLKFHHQSRIFAQDFFDLSCRCGDVRQVFILKFGRPRWTVRWLIPRNCALLILLGKSGRSKQTDENTGEKTSTKVKRKKHGPSPCPARQSHERSPA
jgi:hypothetical protein